MKKIIFTVFVSVFFLNQGIAQNHNLQFNQAIFSTIQSPIANNSIILPFIIGTITVPNGKVWKIESVEAHAGGNGINSIQAHANIFIDDYLIYLDFDGHNHFPIWLPEGTYSIKAVNYASPTPVIHSASYSGIEFNLVP